MEDRTITYLTRAIVHSGSLLFAALLLLPATTYAVDHEVLGSQLLVKNLSTPERRKVSVKAQEPVSGGAIVGDPVANGAMLTIGLNAGSADVQTFNLPAAISPTTSKPYWRGD